MGATGRAARLVAVAVALSIGLSACGPTGGSVSSSGGAADVDDSSTGAGQGRGISGTYALDLCQRIELETQITQRYGLQGPPADTASLPVVGTSGYQEVWAVADLSRFTISCDVMADSVGEWVAHEGGPVVEVSLIVDPTLAFTPSVAPAGVPNTDIYEFEHSAHPGAVDLEEGMLTVQLAETTYLRLQTVILDGRPADANMPLLLQPLAADMIDAWDQNRVPSFAGDASFQRNVAGICDVVFKPLSEAEILSDVSSLAVTSTGELAEGDGIVTPRFTCAVETTEQPNAEAERGERLSVTLSWAADEADVSLAGGASSEGCVEAEGIVLVCQPDFIHYATTTGHWLVQTSYRDESNAVDLTKITDDGAQQAVVTAGERVTRAISGIELSERWHGTDPRVVDIDSPDQNPWDLACIEGEAVEGFSSERVTAIICETTAGEAYLDAMIDDQPFHGLIWDRTSGRCAVDPEHLIDGEATNLCVTLSDARAQLATQTPNPVFREFLDEVWIRSDRGFGF